MDVPVTAATGYGATGTRRFPSSPASTRTMSRKFEIRSGRRTVSIQTSSSPLQAAVDYARSFGCARDEIVTIGVDTVAWRGARFSAVPVPADPEPAH